MAKIPFTHGKSFSELGIIGKVTVVSSIAGTIVGAIFTIWSTVVFAGERAELYISDVVHEQAPEIIKVEMQEFQKQQEFYHFSHQVQFLRLEQRAIEAEMGAITRGKTADQLTADDISRLETLRSDRQRILDQMIRYQSQMRKFQQENN